MYRRKLPTTFNKQGEPIVFVSNYPQNWVAIADAPTLRQIFDYVHSHALYVIVGGLRPLCVTSTFSARYRDSQYRKMITPLLTKSELTKPRASAARPKSDITSHPVYARTGTNGGQKRYCMLAPGWTAMSNQNFAGRYQQTHTLEPLPQSKVMTNILQSHPPTLAMMWTDEVPTPPKTMSLPSLTQKENYELRILGGLIRPRLMIKMGLHPLQL